MTILKPWADGPFELILHAELHLQSRNDFDRKIALISFDNAIEVAITTYLQLHPTQRQNKSYNNTDVDKWLANYHSKLDFFFIELVARKLTATFEKGELVWFHEVRNGQYHSGGPTIPRERELKEIRQAALFIFSVLFDVSDVEAILKNRIGELLGDHRPKRTKDRDLLIDGRYGVVEVAGLPYYTSELLFSIDPTAYENLLLEIQSEE